MPIPKNSPSIEKRRLSDVVFDSMRDQIIRGDLEPDQELSDPFVMRHTGASRSTAREVVDRLVMAGFVVSPPRRASRVAPLDHARVRQQIEVLAALHSAIARDMVPALTDAEVASLVASRGFGPTGPSLDSFARPLLTDWTAMFANRVVRDIEAEIHPHIERAVRLGAALPDNFFDDTQRSRAIDALERRDGESVATSVAEYFAAIADTVAPAEQRGATEPEPDLIAPHLLWSQVFDVLVERILDGTFVPDERLDDGELAEWVGVSRAPVRQALSRLVVAGLAVEDGGDFLVAPNDNAISAEVGWVTGVLHTLAASRIVARIDDAGVARFRMMLEEMRPLKGDPAAYGRLAFPFLNELNRDDVNAVARDIVERQTAQRVRYFAHFPPVDPIEESFAHAESMVEGLAMRDTQRVLAGMDGIYRSVSVAYMEIVRPRLLADIRTW